MSASSSVLDPPSPSTYSLGWYYIIETLADSKAELPLLKGFLCKGFPDKEGRFYCPCCACARAKKVFSLARKSLSSFLKMKENQNQEKGERGKQKVEKNITGKREDKKVVSSDDDTAEGENGERTA